MLQAREDWNYAVMMQLGVKLGFIYKLRIVFLAIGKSRQHTLHCYLSPKTMCAELITTENFSHAPATYSTGGDKL